MSWEKKITKSVGGDLGGEALVAGMLVHQSGFTANLAAKAAGGLVGAAIAAKLRSGTPVDGSTGVAATVPKESLVLGLTDTRVLVWSWAKLTGKPKQLLASFPVSEVAGMHTESKKASIEVVWVFGDGSGVTLEAPKLANDAEGFAAELNRRCPQG